MWFRNPYCCREKMSSVVNNNNFNRQASKIRVTRRCERGCTDFKGQSNLSIQGQRLFLVV